MGKYNGPFVKTTCRKNNMNQIFPDLTLDAA